MESRRRLRQAVYETISEARLSNDLERESLFETAYDLDADLMRLKGVPESTDLIEEAHLRFLARCRLINIGKYQVIGFVGAGRCGAVYRARLNGAMPREDALKIQCFPRNQEEQQRFKAEGDLLSDLNHQAIVKGYCLTQTIEWAPVQWFAMELLTNSQTLGRYVERNSLKAAVTVLAKACEGLAYAHCRGVVHRDLHLENILVLNSADPKILDFGAAKHTENVAELLTFRPVGSLSTCAPEKLQDSGSVDATSDMFSIGCILYYAIRKKWPFYGSTFGKFIENLLSARFEELPNDNVGLSEIVHKLLSTDRGSRPTASELAVTLREIQERF